MKRGTGEDSQLGNLHPWTEELVDSQECTREWETRMKCAEKVEIEWEDLYDPLAMSAEREVRQ